MFEEFEDLDAPESESAAGDELLPPREMVDCLGHKEIEEQLAALSEAGRMPHALIFAGPQGIGKATMAFRLARFLLDKERSTAENTASGPGLFGEELPPAAADNNNENGALYTAPKSRIFRQVVSGGHADLLYIQRSYDDKKNRYKAGVDVEEVRKITPFMRKTASQGGWRIVIVDDADTMNRSAQNAILKILEEPPEKALLILVTHRPGRLIPTIHSRCRILPFLPLEKDDFTALIKRAHSDLSAADNDVLYELSAGRPGQALSILEEGGLEIVTNILDILGTAPDWDWPRIHKMADTLARPGHEDAYNSFQFVLMWIVNAITRGQARNKSLPEIMQNPGIAKLQSSYSLVRWLEIAGQLQDHFDTVQRSNLDKRHGVLGAFSYFQDSKEPART